MIPNEKLVEIAKGLLEKTRKKEAAWQPWHQELDRFELSLPNSLIEVRLESSKLSPDVLMLSIKNSEGLTVGYWAVEEESEYWPLAWSLYQEITKQYTKWDKALAEVEEFIHK